MRQREGCAIFIGLLLIAGILGCLGHAEETFGVPLPVIGLDPNEGALLGVLLAVVSEDEGRLYRIMSPVASYNELIGYAFDMNYFGFPSDDIAYKLYLSHTSNDFWGYRIDYSQEKLFADFLRLKGYLGFDRTASNRFYGIGMDSDEDEESSYTARRLLGEIALSAEFAENLYLSLAIKGRRVWVRKGVVEDVASIEEKFPNVEGGEGGYCFPLEIALLYDSRNCPISPESGMYLRLFCEISDESFLSSFSARRFGVSGKAFFTLNEDGRFTTAVHGLLEYLDGDDIPFFELSSLGGSTSLRGFGAGRFYDEHRILCNVEERIRLFRWPVGEIFLDIETVLFVDVGQVVSSLRHIDFRDMEAVFGTGMRFVVRSQLVAKVDFGFGSEGSQVYAGLDYPF